MSGRGYLGKISAVVTANTSDFERKLQAGAKVADQFGRSMAGVLSSASAKASRSLGEIFTPLQKVQRAMAAATNQTLDIKTSRSVAQIGQLVDVTEQLLNPLAKTAKGVAALSLELQGRLDPSLRSAQSAVLELTDALAGKQDISSGAFARAAEQVNAAERALASATAGQEAYRRGIAATASAYDAAITKERELLALRQKQQQASANSRRDSLSGAAGALTGKIPLAQAPIADVTSGLAARAKEARAAVAAALQTPAAGDLQQRLRSVKAELENIASEEQRLRSIDPLGEQVAQWAALDERIRTADFRLGAVTTTAKSATSAMSSLANSEAELRAQQEARLAVANNLLRVDQKASELLSNEGAASTADGSGRSILERMRAMQGLRDAEERRRSDGPIAPPVPPGYGQLNTDIGRSVDDPQRQMERLRGSIVSVKGQLDELPEAVQNRFLPALREAEQEFLRLSRSPTATRAEIDAAAQAVVKLGSNINTASAFAQKLETAFRAERVKRFTADYQSLQQIIVRIGATTGPVTTAFERLSSEAQEFASAGTLASQANIRKLRDLEAEVVRLVAEYSGLSVAQLKAQQSIGSARLGGDVGRGGADKASLALNQLAFAVDDFLSSTGGIEFKLRAISNNITQLGFVAGGTTGLFITLGAVIAGQLAVAIAKFVFETDKADAALEALNDAIEKNKQNVEQLADAYKRLADEIAKSVLSPRDSVARDRRERKDEIDKGRRKVEEEAFASQSPEVARVRGERAILQKRLKESNDIEQRLALQRQIKEKNDQERQLLESRGSTEGEGLVRRGADQGLQQRAALVNRARLQKALGLGGQDAIDEAERALEQARKRQGEAARTTLPGATTTQNTREQLAALQAAQAQAQADFDAAVAAGIKTNQSQGLAPRPDIIPIDALEKTINDLKDRIALISSVLGGQIASELIDAGFRIQDTLNQISAGLENVGFISELQAQRDKLAKELTAIADELATVSDPARGEALREQQKKIEENAASLLSATRSVEGFAAALDRVAGQLAATVLGEVESAADKSRREANAALGAVNAPVLRGDRRRVQEDRQILADQTQDARQRADADVRRARAGQQEFRRREQAALAGFEADVLAGREGPEERRLAKQRDDARKVLDDPASSVENRRVAQGILDSAIQGLDALFENSPAGRALAEFADQLDQAAQSAAEVSRQEQDRREAIQRGRELSMTPAQRVAADISADLDAIRQFYGALAVATTGLVDFKAQQEAIKRTVEDRAAQVAPLMAGFREERLNALLQGPSRAALNASDINTTEGNNELNRLLRGDDPSKDVNLVELQKQSDLLQKLLEEAQKAAAGQVVEIAG